MSGVIDPADVAKIARGLTKAQSRAVTGAAYVDQQGVWFPAGWYTAPADRRVRYRLACANLTRDYLRRSYPLTPLGLAVRQHILAQEQAA